MKKIKTIITILTLSMATVSCSDLTELNQNPAKALTMDPNMLIPTIQMSHSLGRQNAARFFAFPGNFMNHWTGSWGPVEYGGKGLRNNEYTTRLWQDLLYPEAVRNIVAMEMITGDDPAQSNFSAIAKLLRVETFLKLTDAYGDVPYYEGGQGYYKNIFNPTYDSQQEIYTDFFRKIDAALAQFNPGARIATGDCYFKGDIAKWKKFANSLKLRIAMRLIKVEPELAKEKAKEALTAGVMASNADIAAVVHGVDYETLGAANAYADIMLQATGSTGFGPSQYRMTTEFFKALCVMDPVNYAEAPFRRFQATDPRLSFIARSYFSTKGAGLNAYNDAIDITELARKYNASSADQQGPADLSNTLDGFINIGGYLTVPAQDFIYGGGIQRQGENGYTGEEKARSVWANNITIAKIDASTLSAADKEAFKEAIKTANVNAGIAHTMYRLQPSKMVLAVNSPWIHLSYAETQFLLAETTIRGWNIDSETAVSRLSKGFKAAVDQFSLFGATIPGDDQIDEYLAYLLPSIEAGGDTALEEISRQLWILNFMDPFEAWSNVRRTNGMPTAYTKYYNRVPSQNQTGGVAPRRLEYPTDEQSKNKVKWQEAADRMGGKDDWSNRVWWDVQ